MCSSVVPHGFMVLCFYITLFPFCCQLFGFPLIKAHFCFSTCLPLFLHLGPVAGLNMSFLSHYEKLYPKALVHRLQSSASWLQACSIQPRVKAWTLELALWWKWAECRRSHVCLGTIQIIVSNCLREPRCYLDWPFPPQVTGCRLAGERRGGSMIRPDQNGGVWCSLCRCHTHQTVRCPHQVWRSSRKAERLEVESDSKLHSSIFSCVSAAPLTSALVYILYCVCVEVSRRVGRCRCVRQPAGGGKMNQCKRINISSSHTRRKNKFTPLSHWPGCIIHDLVT